MCSATLSHPKSLTSGSECSICAAPFSSWSAVANAWLSVGPVSRAGEVSVTAGNGFSVFGAVGSSEETAGTLMSLG